MRRIPCILSVVAAGCAGPGAYRSSYVAPEDGRARVVWSDGQVQAAGAEYVCELEPVPPGIKTSGAGPQVRLGDGFRRYRVTGRSRTGGGALRQARKTSGGSSSGGGGGLGGDGEVAVVLAAIALATLSIVTVAAAAAPAENPSIGQAIDATNFHNDCTEANP
ncbi:MAG: hypothetical protein AAFX94_05040 [Myxococcota bacterium]